MKTYMHSFDYDSELEKTRCKVRAIVILVSFLIILGFAAVAIFLGDGGLGVLR